MKRFIAIFVALALCLALSLSALAEEIPEISWEKVGIEDYEVEGSFYSLIDYNVKYWIPDFFIPIELSDEDMADNIVSQFITEDGSIIILVQYDPEFKDMTLDEISEWTRETDATDQAHFHVNGYDVLTYNFEELDTQVATVDVGSGNYVDFVFIPISTEGMDVAASLIIASIQAQ